MLRVKLKKISSIVIKHSVGIALLASAFSTPSVYADEEAIDLLNRMNQAVHKLNYSGTLAYLKDNTLSSLHINHTVVNGVESERVVRLNEEGNEVSRELNDFSFASARTIRPEMEKVYSFDMGRENRIANIPCRIITARPKDRERYLQKYCIDATTGMLLDYILVGKSHKPVEQFMFTSINIRVPEGAPAGALSFADPKACSSTTCSDKAKVIKLDSVVATAIVDQGVTANKETTIVAPRAVKQFRQISPADLDDGWVMEALPIGFAISQAPSMKGMRAVKKGQESPSIETKHYIVSDGLSSLSVFVSPFTNEADIGAVKINSGALNVVSQRKGNAIITVVGEVPEETLRNIVGNLRKK
jgi:negative regulator of sigma E activity